MYCSDDYLLNSEEEVLPVLLRDSGEVGVGAGQVAPLPAPQVPAVLHHPDDKVIANLLYRVSHAHSHTLSKQSFLRRNQPRWPEVNFFHRFNKSTNISTFAFVFI